MYNDNSNFGISSLKAFGNNEDHQKLFVITTLDGYIKIFNIDYQTPLFEIQFYSKPLKNLFIDPSKLILYFIDELEKEGLTSLHLFIEENQIEKNEINFFKKVF